MAGKISRNIHSYGFVRGGMKDTERDSYVSQFSAGSLDAIVLQIEAGGVGIDGLHNHCSVMISYSGSWRWDAREQVHGRIARPGITNHPLYIDIFSTLPPNRKGEKQISMDEYVFECVKNKDLNIKTLIQGFSQKVLGGIQ